MTRPATAPVFSVRPSAIAGFAFLAAVAFALYTDIRWEDYYITYRTSRNLVDGHGLVFQPGERLHTFTSRWACCCPRCVWF